MHRVHWTFPVILLFIVVACNKKKDAPSDGAKDSPQKASREQSSANRWTDFNSPKGSFRARFPWGNAIHWPFTGFDPNLPAGITEGMKYRTDQWVQDGDTYVRADYFSIAELRFAPNLTQAKREDLLEGFLKASAEKTKMSLGDFKPVTWAGQPAKEYEATEPTPSGSSSRIVIRILATDRYGFIGSVCNKTGKLHAVDLQTFFDSFVVTSKGPVPQTKSK